MCNGKFVGPCNGKLTPTPRAGSADPLLALTPARGVIEVKGTGEDVARVAESAQVRKYLERYGLALVTNYRDFVLVGREDGEVVLREGYSLAESETAFWQAARDPHAFAAAHEARLTDYLRRVLLYNAPLTAPQDVAAFLASYAREAKARIEAKKGLSALAALRKALEEGLGLTFEGERGDHFFLSTFVQTLFYGVFSAWVLWHKKRPGRTDSFDWRTAAYTLHVPFIRELFEQLAVPSRLEPLGLIEVLDWTGAALNRVERAAFFVRFAEDQAVQYFYEPFLEAFDPQLRKELGVWYTPPEIVRYMVARVDTVLRTELNIADGLADPRVYVLDPCCGTGAYPVEVLRHIYASARENEGDASGAQTVKRAAMNRIFGFELLPAPFVVAHLQLGLLLQSLGAPLDDKRNERAGVYLTNALTGWEPPDPQKEKYVQAQLEGMPQLLEERDAAEKVKRDTPILVILGNPPYNGYAGLAITEERALSTAYRTTKVAPAPQGQGLNDLYVRFFRMAERRIVEQGGQGVVCYISNYSWLDGLSFTGMRERYLELFDSITIDSLNGDKYRTGKLTPDGQPDPSVFSTDTNREGIQVGTAITTLVRKPKHGNASSVLFRDMWGKTKRTDLLASLDLDPAMLYQSITPPLALGLPFMPNTVGESYTAWPLLPQLFPVQFPGVKTSRDDVVVSIDRESLVQRMEHYFDPTISHSQMRQIAPGVMEDSARFIAEPTRDLLRKRGFLPQNIVRYCYRPFDVRWLYWEPETKLLDEKRAEYFPHVFEGNVWLGAVQQNRKDFDPPIVSARLCSLHIVERGANLFPLYLKRQGSLFDNEGENGPKPNLSDKAEAYLKAVDATAPELFYHTIAILHAPAYREENGGALRQDWPRIPLPQSATTLRLSAAHGRQIVALLDTETPVAGVTYGPIRAELRRMGILAVVNGTTPDYTIHAGWGHAGQGGVTMPGKGKHIERDYTDDERAALIQGTTALGLSPEQALHLLGDSTGDVYLNATTCWRNVPANVWDYTIGGYQVMKKWLSYREEALLGRAITAEEAKEVMNMVRRIAAILLMTPNLDTNYASVASATYSWAGSTSQS